MLGFFAHGGSVASVPTVAPTERQRSRRWEGRKSPTTGVTQQYASPKMFRCNRSQRASAIGRPSGPRRRFGADPVDKCILKTTGREPPECPGTARRGHRPLGGAQPQSQSVQPPPSAVRFAALVAPLLTSALLSTVRESVTATTSVLVLVVWVVGAAATGDRVAAVRAAVSAGVWFDFFLTEPYLAFTIANAHDIEATSLLVVIGLAVSELALWGYRQQKQAARRSGYLEGVLGAARSVAEGTLPLPGVLQVVGRQVSEVLGADSCHRGLCARFAHRSPRSRWCADA